MRHTTLWTQKDGVIHIHRDKKKVDRDLHSLIVEGDLDKCSCDFHVKIVNSQFSLKCDFVSPRFDGIRRRGIQEMYKDILEQISSTWTFGTNGILELKVDNVKETEIEKIRTIVGDNMISMPPAFPYRAVPTEELLSLEPNIVKSYQMWDVKYFTNLGMHLDAGFFVRNVWGPVKFDSVYYPSWIKDRSVPSLKILALRKASHFNQVLSGDKIGPYANYSLTDIYSKSKAYKAFSKYSQPTADMEAQSRKLGIYMCKAMFLMYRYAGWNKMFKRDVFNFDPDTFDVPITPLSVSGIRSGPRMVISGEEDRGYKIVLGVNGCKLEQHDYALRKVREMYHNFKNGNPVTVEDRANKCSIKREVHFGFSEADRIKASTKARIYMIPTATQFVLAHAVNHVRQEIERGQLIRIGFNWFSGGANELAEYLLYKREGYKWFEYDYTGLDRTLKSTLLRLYNDTSGVYYDQEKGDYDFYRTLSKLCGSMLCDKQVHLMHDIWVRMIGVMPSGVYQTSHGDSWINSLLVFTFWIYQSVLYPIAQGKIVRAIETKSIRLAVYGDDTLCAMPADLLQYIGPQIYKVWVHEFFSMSIRDIIVHDKFLSEPNFRTGEFVYKGPTFLQVQFIANDATFDSPGLPNVLPYKSLWRVYTKFAFGSGEQRTSLDYILAALGMVYDTKGTNKIAYEFCKHQFQFYIRMVNMPWKEVCAYLMKTTSAHNITQHLIKSHISKEELIKGFPTLERLMEMHINDPFTQKNAFKEEWLKRTEN